MNNVISIGLAFWLLFFVDGDFKKDQLRYMRVRTAYAQKEKQMQYLLQQSGVSSSDFEVYIRVFKHEKELELWAKDDKMDAFKLIKTYPICKTCGTLGPKRKEGDLQIPEGFYHIDAYNPASSYHLSMRINYPNKSDRILGYKPKLGGNICIHGNCVTIGCVPITDDKIKELYIFCVEAKDKGQQKIPVTIYPARMSDKNFSRLKELYGSEVDKISLWQDLKVAYDDFLKTNSLPEITFLSNGRHLVE